MLRRGRVGEGENNYFFAEFTTYPEWRKEIARQYLKREGKEGVPLYRVTPYVFVADPLRGEELEEFLKELKGESKDG